LSASELELSVSILPDFLLSSSEDVSRRDVAQCGVKSDVVVVVDPLLEDVARFFKAAGLVSA
jgi:hypothetical protein